MGAQDDYNQMKTTYFQGRRQDAAQQGQTSLQQGQDALDRRFAALGAQGSGAAIGASMQNQQNAADVTRKANADVNTQEMVANEQDIGRRFQGEEAEKARTFANDQGGLQRNFQSGMADKDMAFKQGLANTAQGNKLTELDLAKQQLELDKQTTEFNKQMAELEAGQAPPPGIGGQIKKLTEPLGDLYTPKLIKDVAHVDLGCFLTTACVGAMGLSDECWALTKAREFRDTYMAETPERAAEIMEYYGFAPKIVEGINAGPEPKKTWISLFWKSIIPFVAAIDKGEMPRAHDLYKELIFKAKSLGGIHGS